MWTTLIALPFLHRDSCGLSRMRTHGNLQETRRCGFLSLDLANPTAKLPLGQMAKWCSKHISTLPCS